MVTSGERNKPVRLHRFKVSLHKWVILSLINGYKWGEEQAGQTTQIQGKSTQVGYPFSDKWLQVGRGTKATSRSNYTDSKSR